MWTPYCDTQGLRVKIFPCPYCHFTTPYPHTLLAHKSAAHRDLDCTHCGRLLSTWWAYERHQRTFHPTLIPEQIERERKTLEAALKPPPLASGHKRRGRKKVVQKCPTCGMIFKSRPALTYHISTKHDSTMYMCEQCPAVFSHRTLLASHTLRHGERRVMCHRCGRKFFTHKQLNSHENLFHRRAKSYSCDKCGGCFSTLRVLRHHQRTQPHHHQHTSHSCQECGVSYSQHNDYLDHLLTHGLKCVLCSQTFSSASVAHQHYQKMHANTNSKSDSNYQQKIDSNFQEIDSNYQKMYANSNSDQMERDSKSQCDISDVNEGLYLKREVREPSPRDSSDFNQATQLDSESKTHGHIKLNKDLQLNSEDITHEHSDLNLASHQDREPQIRVDVKYSQGSHAVSEAKVHSSSNINHGPHAKSRPCTTNSGTNSKNIHTTRSVIPSAYVPRSEDVDHNSADIRETSFSATSIEIVSNLSPSVNSKVVHSKRHKTTGDMLPLKSRTEKLENINHEVAENDEEKSVVIILTSEGNEEISYCKHEIGEELQYVYGFDNT